MLFYQAKENEGCQVTIITRIPEEVIHTIQKSLRRGITIINEAEGAYKHDKTDSIIDCRYNASSCRCYVLP